MSWFTELPEVRWSEVEHISRIGTIYSLKRDGIPNQYDWKGHWRSLAHALESSIRDVILFPGIGEPAPVAYLNTMAEKFTDEMLNLNFLDRPDIQMNKNLDTECEHVLIGETSKGKFASQAFGNIAKGVHHFYGAVFIGTLIDPLYAPKGEQIRLDIPHGLYDGAQVTFSWKWTKDALGAVDRSEIALGFIKLEAGKPTRFVFSKRKGAGGWAGYDFSGQIKSKDYIVATNIGRQTTIEFRRV